jgi:hypothetical protein
LEVALQPVGQGGGQGLNVQTPSPGANNNLGQVVNDRHEMCREKVFGNAKSIPTGRVNKPIPSASNAIRSIIAGGGVATYAAMVAAIWSQESSLKDNPDGDAGPAQLTTWWKRNHPELIVGNAYGTWKGRTEKPFDGNVQDNVNTLGNIVVFSYYHYRGNLSQIPYWYGSGLDRAGYANEVMRLYGKYVEYFSCILGQPQ